MTRDRQETRAEEVARVRSYLSSQAMRRTPEQLVETLREAHQQLLTATAAIPDAAFHTPPREGEWSAADVLAHVRTIAAFDERAIAGVLERGEQPANVKDTLEHAPASATREQLLAEITALRERLIKVVLQADPQAQLDILWGHTEFGQMNWREWLLFARVHTLDHVRQIQAIAAALSSAQPS
ncbi:MAG TPA: DinB family protein [Ktedonobacteraceae bacterium]|nr:DinB family protein [Ktedonobacteraceae bacterium]